MNETRRILQCLRAPVGGLFRHVADLTMELSDRGHEVGILCDANTGGNQAEEQLTRLERHCSLGIVRIPMQVQPGFHDISAIWETSKLIRKLKPDILHGHGAKGGAYVRLARMIQYGSKSRIRTFYTPHGGSLHYSAEKLKGRIFLDLEKRLSALTDGIVFESAYSSRIYHEKVGAPSCRTKIIHNGLNKSEFYRRSVEKKATDFLFVGELRQLKGLDVFIKALSQLNNKNIKTTATIIGSGKAEKQFKEQVKSLGLQERVFFRGTIPARNAFPQGRCLVVPSRAESLPYIVLEAAAAQIPLISSQVGGIPEIVEGVDFPLVQAGSVSSLVNQMNDFLNSRDEYLSQTERLQHVVSKRFRIEKMVDDIVDFYMLDPHDRHQ
ncbi:MAG: glycosyltransferase family 4 protein [bacterium]|nr:glycosyltransferase family 4 protein [bacterium]